MTHKSLFVAAAVVLSIGAANAADLPVKAAPMPLPVWTWEGTYIGVNGGYSWSRADTTCTGLSHFCLLPSSGDATSTTPGGTAAALAAFNALFTTSHSPKVDGGVIGGHIGRNWQNGHWVWGFEADLDWSNERASLSSVATLNIISTGNFLAVSDSHTYDWRLNWFGSARVRVGFAQDTWLLYVTGGLAVGAMSYSATNLQLSTTTSPGGTVLASGVLFSAAATESVTRLGGAVGAGIEKAFTNNLIARVEYLYLDFGTHTFIGGNRTFEANIRLHDNIVRGALSWKFDCCAVVARY